MMMKKITLIFLLYFLLLLIFIGVTWVKYYSDISTYGGEMADGFFLLALILATIYYFFLTVWTYIIYRSNFANLVSIKIQLTLLFVLGVLSSLFLLGMAYL